MNSGRLIRNNLTYYWRKNLLLVLGVAISGAVITGALMVGDSVQYSLNRIVQKRLGTVTHLVRAGDRYFTETLAGRMGEALGVSVTSLLLQEGSATGEGGQVRVNRVQVLGVDSGFDIVAGQEGLFGSLAGDSIIISNNLAARLNASPGEEVLLRVEKASLIPRNAPFVSDEGTVSTLRAVIKGVAGEEQLGRFNLKVSQTSPFNVFISRERLRELMEFSERVNVMLLQGGADLSVREIREALDAGFAAADAGLTIRVLEERGVAEVTSDRVFMDDALVPALTAAGSSAEGIITYFVNHLESRGRHTPYSFVSTLTADELEPGEILINDWLARDLGAGNGDTLVMTYFEVGPLRELNEVSASFTVKDIVPMRGRFGDPTLMPDLPGLSDVANCRDWETGVPIKLEAIRDRDEDYWDDYRGMPKAFISIEKGKELWHNRFGTYTAFRYPLERIETTKALESSIMEGVDPSMLGFTVEATRSAGEDAAANGVDFSQLFAGLSFFLLVAGILLTVLLFLLNIESREGQLRDLVVMGIPMRLTRRITLAETGVVVLAGSLTGLLLAVVYNRLVFMALNGVWGDVVHTDMMQVDVRIVTLVTGWLVSVAVALLAILVPLNRKLKRAFRSHLRPTVERPAAGGAWSPGAARKQKVTAATRKQRVLAASWIFGGIASLVMIASELARGEVVNVPLFFGAGGLLLVSSVLCFLWFLGEKQHPSGEEFDLSSLGWKNAARNRTRSMSIVVLFSIGAFLVITTGSNRKDLFRGAGDRTGGTGGFLYYAESTLPVLRQLNDPGVRAETGLEGDYEIVQLRVAEGDDASCLNLNKIVNPRILGVDPGDLEGRFSFVTSSDELDTDCPWCSLEKELDGGVIPALADETVIKWGLGLEVGDTLRYTDSGGGTMELLLVGGMAPTIFQGNVVISNDRFLEHFPESSGTRVFLVEGQMADTAVIASELGRAMRDLGWEMELASVRLAAFNSVTNAYLSIFMVMGALGLLLGTFGLVVVLSRSIQERRQEIGLLKAVGFGRAGIRRLVTREYMILLLAGIATGFVTAIVATLPSIVSVHTGTSFTTILAWLVILLVNGWIWIRLVTWSALRDPDINRRLRND